MLHIAPCGRTFGTSVPSSGTGSLHGGGIRAAFDHLHLVVERPIGRVSFSKLNGIVLDTFGPWGQRRFALRHEHIRRVGVETLDFPKQPQLRPPQRMFRVMSLLDPMHIEVTHFEIDLVPPEGHELGRAEAMAKHQQNNRRIADAMASAFTHRLHHGVHFIGPQIVSYRPIAFLFHEGSRVRLPYGFCRKRTLAWGC